MAGIREVSGMRGGGWRRFSMAEISFDWPIAVKDALWWAPHDPRAFERVTVTDVREVDGVVYVQTEGVRNRVRYWNREARVRALCRREPQRKSTPKVRGRVELAAVAQEHANA